MARYNGQNSNRILEKRLSILAVLLLLAFIAYLQLNSSPTPPIVIHHNPPPLVAHNNIHEKDAEKNLKQYEDDIDELVNDFNNSNEKNNKIKNELSKNGDDLDDDFNDLDVENTETSEEISEKEDSEKEKENSEKEKEKAKENAKEKYDVEDKMKGTPSPFDETQDQDSEEERKGEGEGGEGEGEKGEGEEREGEGEGEEGEGEGEGEPEQQKTAAEQEEEYEDDEDEDEDANEQEEEAKEEEQEKEGKEEEQLDVEQIARTFNIPSWKGIKTFIMFVGYPRTAHSMVGSFIDAHPQAVIAHEYDILTKLKRYNETDAGKTALFNDLYINTVKIFEQKDGRIQNGYQYTVPHQFNGKVRPPVLVIGDKKGGTTAANLKNKLNLLDVVHRIVKVPIKLIHVIRNPYDAMASHTDHNGGKESQSQIYQGYLKRFIGQTQVIGQLKEQHKWPILDIHSEKLIANPEAEIMRLMKFVGLDVDAKFLADCASIVFDKPQLSRQKITWRQEDIAELGKLIDETPWFQGYTYD